ncbi:Hypothetical protein R9X50_00324500 [Acrodontium crateriforme]|uniref:Uncharacterized protein n=1 Tax=Acrodontium crateriforme TaxID=150365 RepID=A0AAQ3RBP8_9PEZI|nr:Hypothetical protein R9X50_00324500 [Acrodontium crateriforme]
MWKFIVRAFRLLFLLSLPITLPAIINGLYGGIAFSFWRTGHIERNLDCLDLELGLDSSLNSFSVPGARTFLNFEDEQDTIYHVPQLHTRNWADTLNFVLPKEHRFSHQVAGVDVGIDAFASFNGLMRDISRHPSEPDETWVYISGLSTPGIDAWLSEWDKAFDRLVQFSYNTQEQLNQSRLAFVDCDSTGFLCGVWGVRSPALIHMKVLAGAPSRVDLNPDLTYDIDLKYLRSVSIRVIELPLESSISTGLSKNTFPGHFEQLLAVIGGENFWEQYETWDDSEQLMKLYDGYVRKLTERRGTLRYYLSKYERWTIYQVTEPIGIQERMAQVQTTFFLFATLATELVRLPIVITKAYVDAWTDHLIG